MDAPLPAPTPGHERHGAFEALMEIGGRLHGASADVDVALDLVVDRAQELLGTDLAWLVLADNDRDVLRPAVIRGFRSDRFLEVELPSGSGVGGCAIAQGRPLVVDDYETHDHASTPAVREAILREGTVALICAPMLRDDELVGTLYVANRSATAFTDDDAWLLGALAAQASVAIESRRLLRRLTDQNALLEQAFSVHRRLTQASLDETGLVGLAGVLTELIGLPLTVRQEICEPRVLHVSRGPLQLKALEQGITLLALELLKQRASLEVGWRMSGELLEELLDSPQPVPAPLARRAAHVQVDVTAEHRMLAIAPVDPRGDRSATLLEIARGMVARRAPGNGSHALGLKRGHDVLLALPPQLEAEAAGVARAIQAAAAPSVGELLVGVGPRTTDFGRTCRGAVACLSLARDTHSAAAVVEYDTLGSLRFLLDAPDLRNAAEVAREPLAALIDHDAHHRTPLLQTTRAFVECGGHYGRTAERCFVAVSTLKYRIRKVEGLLGAHPADPDLAFRLSLAFKVQDLLTAAGPRDDDAAGRPPVGAGRVA
jgi:sugar diacid utilization regulator